MFTTFGWKKKIVITEGISMNKKVFLMEAKASLFPLIFLWDYFLTEFFLIGRVFFTSNADLRVAP